MAAVDLILRIAGICAVWPLIPRHTSDNDGRLTEAKVPPAKRCSTVMEDSIEENRWVDIDRLLLRPGNLAGPGLKLF